MRALLPVGEVPPSLSAALGPWSGASRPTRGLRGAPARTPAPSGAAGRGETWTVHQAADLWDRHGVSVYALACALIGDEKPAIGVVTQAMQDLVGSAAGESAGEARGALTRYVYRRSLELTGGVVMTGSLPPAMVWLSRLADLQRTSLALCVFGGQTHREAADLIGIPAHTVAHLLTSGLRELSRDAADEPR